MSEPEKDQKTVRSKIVILEERTIETQELPPPNFQAWFVCVVKWDRLEEVEQ